MNEKTLVFAEQDETGATTVRSLKLTGFEFLPLGYRIRARDAVPNYSAFTALVYVTTPAAGDSQAPTTPSNFAVVASSSTGAVLTWGASTDNVGVTGYQIERCQGSGCTTSFTQFNISASTGWTNTGLTAGTTYGYRMRASDAVPNYSAFTTIVYITTPAAGDTQAPTTPSSFAVVASSSTGAVLTWGASTDNVGVTGYQIERCQGSGCTTSFTQFNISASTGWTNTGLTAGTTYGYRMRASDAVPNYSAFTGIVHVTTPSAGGDTQAPTTPSNLSVVADSSTQVSVGWTASTDNVGVTGYQVERCQGAGCTSSFTQFDVTATGYTDTGRPGGIRRGESAQF
jgi:chitodextrinase